MPIATLTIDMVAKMANLQTRFDRAAQIAEKNSRRIDQAFKTVGRTLAAVGAGFTLDRVIDAFNRSLEGVAKFKDLAEQTGIAVEELSKIEPVARGAGVGLDEVAALSQKLSRALSGVDDETRGVGKALAQIGLDAGKLRQMGAAEQLQAIAQALGQYADDGNKVALVQGILGRTGAQYLSFLKDLGEAGTLVATVTAEQARQADDYNKAIAAVKLEIEGLGRTISLSVLPSLRDMIGEFRDGIEVFGGFWEALRQVGSTNPFKSQQANLDDLRQQLVELQDIKGKGFFGESWLAQLFDPVDDRIRRTQLLIDYFERRVKATRDRSQTDPGPPIAERPSVGAFVAPRERAAAATRSQVSEFQKLEQSLQRQLDATQELSVEEQTRLAIARAAAGTFSSGQSARLVEMAQSVDAETAFRRAVEDSERAVKAANVEQQQLNEARRRWLDEATGRAGASMEAQRLEQIDEAFFAGRINAQEYDNALQSIYRGLGDVARQQEQTNSLAQDLGLTFTSAFEDAVIAGRKFSDVLKSLGEDIARIFLRQTVTVPLANWLGSLLPVPGKAVGGPVMAGSPYIVGERGPELFVPERSGSIVPNGKFGAGVTVVQYNTFGAGVSRAELAPLLERNREATLAELNALASRNSPRLAV